MVKVASSVTLEGIVATQFNADEGMKAAPAQSILDRSNGAFDEVIDIVAGGGRRRLDDGAGVGVSYTGVARVDGTDDAASVGADLLEQASDALTAAVGDGSFLTTLQAADTAFAAVTVDVAATQTAIADAVLEVIVTTPGPTASPTTPQRTSGPTTTPGGSAGDGEDGGGAIIIIVVAVVVVLALAGVAAYLYWKKKKKDKGHEGRARNEGIVVHGRSGRRRRGRRRRSRAHGVADRRPRPALRGSIGAARGRAAAAQHVFDAVCARLSRARPRGAPGALQQGGRGAAAAPRN